MSTGDRDPFIEGKYAALKALLNQNCTTSVNVSSFEFECFKTEVLLKVANLELKIDELSKIICFMKESHKGRI